MALYEPVHDQLLRYCETLCNGDVEEAKDLYSEVIMSAYENFDQLRKKEAFLFFLFGIARNRFRKKFRRKKFRAESTDQEMQAVPDHSINPERALEIKMLYKVMEQLPEKQKEALILFEISGFSIKEVAGIQGSGESAVKVRLMRARQRLSQLMKENLPVTQNRVAS